MQRELWKQTYPRTQKSVHAPWSRSTSSTHASVWWRGFSLAFSVSAACKMQPLREQDNTPTAQSYADGFLSGPSA
jgi:hypothetical protein